MEKKIRIAKILIVALLFELIGVQFGLFCGGTAQASTTKTTGECIANALYVRSGPGTNYSILTQADGSYVKLAKGDKVTIQGTSGDWYKVSVNYHGTTYNGYCFAQYIKKITPTVTPAKTVTATPTATKKATATPTPTPAKTGTSGATGTVNSNVLNIRSGTSTSYSKVGTLAKGAKVNVIGTAKDSQGRIWYKITATISGKTVTGYVFGEYLTVSGKIATATPTPTKKATATPTPTAAAKVGYVNATTLNVRSGAGTSYTKLTSISKNTSVTILGNAKDSKGQAWYKVSLVSGKSTITGYVFASYITVTAKPTSAPTKKPTATVTPKPTATPTKKPTATSTPKPTATSTPKPTATNTPKPTATSTPKPTATNTPKPTATNTPTPTSTPIPTATSTPKPTATGTPKPTAAPTNTPIPTATSTPTPTCTPIPTESVPKTDGTTENGIHIAATINATILNMRSGAGTEFSKITTMSNGQAITVTGSALDSNGDVWYEVTAILDGATYKGYMFGKYLALSEPLPEKTEEEYVPTEGSDLPYYIRATMTGSSVNMRTGPSTEYSVIMKLSDLQTVYVIGEAWNGSIIWYHIAIESGDVMITGYCSSTYVKLNYGTSGFWANANASGVTVYQTPSESGSVVKDASGNTMKLDKGTYVFMTEEQMVSSVKWNKIAFLKGDTVSYGYVKATYLTLCKDSEEGSFDPFASNQSFEDEMRALGFPESYLPYLTKLHNEHPNWKFQPFVTGLDWNTVIANEDVVGRNLIPNSRALKWLSFAANCYNWNTDKFIPYDGSTWVTVSNAGLQYFMDPRNWLTDNYIFMFEELSYNCDNQTKEGVECILKGTPMYKKSFTYTDANGNQKTMLYSEAFMEAAQYSGVSPYHLASRAKQEVVISANAFSLSATGTVSGYEGLHNFYNIGASNSTAQMGAIKNGLKFAKYGGTNATLNKACLIPWNNIHDAIVGGAYYIGYNYISRGQNSIYLQKFNVTGRSTYNHQYMGNVEAPKSEGYKVYLAYKAMEDYEDMTITFSIPVYNNMTEKAVSEPSVVYNPNNYLSAITVTSDSDGGKVAISPTFSYDVTEYTAKVSETVTSVTISAKTVAASAKITGGLGTYNLTSGENKIILEVTAANGTIRNYTITITK